VTQGTNFKLKLLARGHSGSDAHSGWQVRVPGRPVRCSTAQWQRPRGPGGFVHSFHWQTPTGSATGTGSALPSQPEPEAPCKWTPTSSK
jgi:hypothetical protein